MSLALSCSRDETPQCYKDQTLQLNAPITKKEEEVLLALKSMPTGKAPGPDGSGCKFYKEFRSILLDPLRLCLIIHLKMGSYLNPLGRPTFLSSLKEGKCPDSCATYRPIALLNSEQKTTLQNFGLTPRDRAAPYYHGGPNQCCQGSELL